MICKYCKERFKEKVKNQLYCKVSCRTKDYYLKNKSHLLDYQKGKQKQYRKAKQLPERERALKAWKTRREQEPIMYKEEIKRLNREIKECCQ